MLCFCIKPMRGLGGIFPGAAGLSGQRQYDKLEFAEGCQGIEQHCHSEPVLRLVWESPSNFGLLIVMQTVLLYRFPEFIHEKWYS